jgi:isopentenyl-diphosphate delta-isomerase
MPLQGEAARGGARTGGAGPAADGADPVGGADAVGGARTEGVGAAADAGVAVAAGDGAAGAAAVADAAGGAAAVAPRAVTGLERYRLAHRALPGRDLAEVGLGTPLLGAVLAAPILLAPPAEAGAIGRYARAASEHGLGLVLRGGERLLADPDRIARYHTPDRPPLLLGALAIEHLLDGDGPQRAQRLVEMLDADGLVLELDIVGAALRAHGDPRVRRAEAVVAAIAERLAPLPLVVRESGSGMDGADARALRDAGAAAVDVGGAGSSAPRAAADLGAAFAGWGVPVGDAVAEAMLMAPGLPVIAGGPLRDGVEIAMCLALGARAACVTGPFANRPAEAASGIAAALVHQLRVAVWAAGAPGAAALHTGHLRDARVP